MARPLIDSPFIFGIHEPGGEHYMLAAGRPGWILFTETVGHDPDDFSGVDYTAYADQGLGIISRLNHGYEPDGTVPHSSQYELFARRVGNFVATSRGCKTWVIGNEMNYAIERPGVKIDWTRHRSLRDGPSEAADPLRRGLAVRFTALPDHSKEIRTTRGAMVSPGEVITPELYARAFKLCRDAIHRVRGHEDDLVLVGAVAPWNTQTIYPGNPNGDWVQYFQDLLNLIGPDGCDGFTVHAYTQGSDPGLISSPVKLAAPFQARHQEFRVYTDFMLAVPQAMRQLPAFLTEAGQAQPWADQNAGWIQAMYTEVEAWNAQTGAQQIRAAILYRWPRLDKWYIAGKEGVEADFREALARDYRWRGAEPAPVLVEEAPAPPPAAEPSPASPAAGRRRRQKPVQQHPYLIEWGDDRFPERLVAGQVVTAEVTLKNAGIKTWSPTGGNPVRLGYHYYRNRRSLPVIPAKDLRTDLSSDVAPGESVTLLAQIALPDDPGNYTLELDLVQEGISWFKEQGSPVRTRWLTVEALQDGSAGKRDGGVQLPVRLFTDIANRLPHSGAPYARRNLNQVKYIVVNHTGANPHVSLDRIAKAHIQRGYPGIAYDFVVDASGQILKVKEMEQVAQPDQTWSEQGVNICLAGNFNQSSPPLPQLDAAGRLCAWLAQNLGMTAENIVGLGELTRSESPGETFYKGAKWKDVLSRQVQLHLAALGMGAIDSGRSRELEAQVTALRLMNVDLEANAKRAKEDVDELRRRIAADELEISELRRQLDAQTVVAEGGMRMHVVVNQLPRDGRRYVARTEQAVANIVINHTGAPVNVQLEEIAHLHRHDWPGILYDFVISAAGDVYQTQPLEQVVDTSEPYIRNSISIAFAGDFTQGRLPTPEQIAAGGRLLNWIFERFPQLGVEDVRGLSDFIATVSPGEQWVHGVNWRQMLLVASGRMPIGSDPALERELRSQIDTLAREVQTAVAERDAFDLRRMELVEEMHQLRAELEAKAATPPSFAVPKPPMRVVVEQLPKHPSLRYERRSLTQITHIAVHHTAAPPRVGPARIAELHVAADPARGKEPWPGIGYHFFIHEDGTIDQTNYLETASYHVFRHYGYSVGVVFAGSFMNGKIPTTAQFRAGAHLIAWLMQELKAPLARVWGHREFPDNMTVCPGGEWTQGNRWRDLLFERIEQVQQGTGLKTARHYMLFWNRDNDKVSGRDDFANAQGYIARYRPTVGFSAEEARSAEFVTIVGSEAGVSAVVEQVLLQAGCKVERIAGRDPGETGRLLAELVRVGRRFRNFEADF